MKRRVDLDNLLSLITRIALGVIFTSVLSACRGQQSALDPVGPQASKISTLFWFFFWVMSAIWIAVMLVMIIAIRRGRQKRVIAESQAMQPEVESNPQDERKLTRAVTIASAITVAILFIILILDFWVGRGLTSLAQQDRVFI
ncbi:MAG TPA: hypothetical protein VEF04_01305, partial [Blastocatellia bacterium]|nr:hypothetical protein [Blastocatellia bacterium]